MGRTLPGNLTTILAGAARDIDWTLDLTFPDTSAFHFGTSPLTAVNGFNYTNEIEAVGEIRQTLEAATDKVSVGIQNKDRVLSQHVGLNWNKWRNAQAVLGRYYYQVVNGSRTGLNQWVKMFRGAVERPNADDLRVTFDIISDVISAGKIVCNRTLCPLCPSLYKDAKTCAYSGGLPTCNHLLKSPDGCDGRANSHHFMGFEHRYNPDVSIPGTGGNGDDPPVFDPPCPRLDQFVRVKGPDGQVLVKMVCFITESDEIWNPKLRRFFPIASCEIVRQQVIWELVTGVGAVGYSSGLHPIIRDIQDDSGLAVERFVPRDRVLAETDQLVQTTTIIARQCSQLGDVMRIEMQADWHGEKLYCYGDAPDKMIVCHNLKDPLLD